jgi:adenine-specific DNA-methyltransferase
MNFYYKSYYGLIHLTGGYLKINSSYLKNLPIKRISEEKQKPLIEIVDRILSITSNSDYSDNVDKQAMVKALEKRIDKLVYDLYGLTKEEVDIIEKS